MTAPAAAAARPPWALTERQLLAEIDAINTAEDQAALRDPCTLLRHLLPTYRRRPHVRLIGAQVARLAAGDIDRLMILTPPQVGKTVTAVVGGALWWLALHPAHRVIISSYSNALAVNRGRSVRKLIIEHGHRYGLALARGSASVADWELTCGGGVKSVGVFGGVAGSPGDFGIVDDPHKSRAEAQSLRQRDRIHDWFSADYLSRLSPGAPVLLIMTPWHHDDLRSRLLADEGDAAEGGRWTVVRMPAMADSPQDPLGRPRGAPLTHPKIPTKDTDAARRHWEQRRAGTKLRDWHALYMCDPQPDEGALLSVELLRQRRCWQTGSCPPPTRAAVAVDPSGGGRDTAGIIGGYLGTDRRLYYNHDRTAVMSSEKWARVACELAVEIDADRIVAEKNYGGDMVALAIRTAWSLLQQEEITKTALKIIGQGGAAATLDAVTHLTPAQIIAHPLYRETARFNRLPPRIVTVTARKNKLLRAEPIAQQWQEDRIRTAAYLPELEQEWATWQPDDPDSPGRIDASVHLAYALLPPAPVNAGITQQARGPVMPSTSASPLGGSSGGPGSLGPLSGR